MKYLFSAIVLLIGALLSGATPPVYSQEVPACTSPASDTDGDGWGWENNASCRVAIDINADVCIDADGDGWGWDGVKSCLVTVSEVSTNPVIAETTSYVDTDGDGYGWDGAATCLANADTTTDNLPDTAPTITNLETGLQVDLVRAHWMPSDFTGYDIACGTHEFDGSVYKFTGDTELYVFDALPRTPPFTSTVNIGLNSNIQEPWGLENGIYSGPGYSLSGAQWVEIVVSIIGDRSVLNIVDIRIWDNDASYTSCGATSTRFAFIPTGVSLEYKHGDCDYSNEALSDGWGWNSEASQSCPPLQQITYGDSSSLQDSLIAEFSGTVFNETQTGTFTLATPTEVRISGYHGDLHGLFSHVKVMDSAGNQVDDYHRIQCLEADTYTVSVSRPYESAVNGGGGYLFTNTPGGRLPFDYTLNVSDNGGNCI